MTQQSLVGSGPSLLESLVASLAESFDEGTRLANHPFRQFSLKYWSTPSAFATECIDWPPDQSPTEYQLAALDAVPQYRRVAVRGPHGLGKTTTGALLLIWYALTREGAGVDWKVVTTASVWRQLEEYLWPEIHKWVKRVRWSKVGIGGPSATQLLHLSLRFPHGKAFAVASDNPTNIEGAHADHILWLFDEAKTIPYPMWEAAEGAMSTGDVYCVAYSTPGDPLGMFFDIHMRKPGLEDWHPIHVTLHEAISSGRVSAEWAEARRRQWGETNPVYVTRVLGDFATQVTGGIVPLAWAEAAQTRWHDWVRAGRPGTPTSIGVDVATGTQDGDQAVVALIYDGMIVAEVQRVPIRDETIGLMELTGRLVNLWQTYKVPIYVDSIGIGAGVAHRLRELRVDVEPVNAGWRTELVDSSGSIEFLNWRAAMWWLTRELFDPGNTLDFKVAIPPDELLLAELTSVTYVMTSSGKIQVESKTSIRQRLRRSTDTADAVVMALIGPALCAERVELESTGGPFEVVDLQYQIGAW